MSFDIKVAKLTGKPNSSGWSQTYDFIPDDPNTLSLRGRLFALISSPSQKQGLDTIVSGREIISRLQGMYFGNIQGKPLDALKDAARKTIAEFSSRGGIEIALVSEVNQVLYMVVGGGSSIFLYRGGNLYKLIESIIDQSVSASGSSCDKDQIVIGSGAFFKSYSRKQIESFLQKAESSASIKTPAPIVYNKEFTGDCAVIVLRFEKQNQTDKIKPFLFRNRENSDILKERSPINSKRFFNETGKKAFGVIKRLGSKDFYLKKEVTEQEEKSKKVSLLVGVLLLLILASSIFFGIRQKKISDFKLSYESQLASADHEIQESYNLFFLNPQRSRELFDSARERVLGLSVREINDPKVEDLMQKIKDGEEKILGQYSISPQLYVDLALFSEGFKVDEISVSGDILYILDKSGRKIIKISLTSKRTENLAGPTDVQDAVSIAAYSGRVFISSPEGLYELDNGRIKLSNAEWGSVLISAYAGNLYVLDKTSSKIFRYQAQTTGFGSKSDWLREGIGVNFSDAKSLMIDGSVWVLTEGGNILKFGLGNLQNFNLKGITPNAAQISNIFTSEESEFLYILEKDAGRMVVVNKEGEYKAQYLDESLKEALRIAVSEKERKAFILTSGKLFSFDLKHL